MPRAGDTSTRQPRFAYPVSLDLNGATVLVVGGGRIGARKAAGAAGAGAIVRLVAPEISEHVDPDDVAELRRRSFQDDDLDGVRLVVTATGIADVDAEVAAAARRRGIWVNAADQPADCDFILPAIVRRGRVSVAVSTDGASPALASALRDVIGDLFADELGRRVEELAAERSVIQQSGGSTEDVDWSARVREIIVSSLRVSNLPA